MIVFSGKRLTKSSTSATAPAANLQPAPRERGCILYIPASGKTERCRCLVSSFDPIAKRGLPLRPHPLRMLPLSPFRLRSGAEATARRAVSSDFCIRPKEPDVLASAPSSTSSRPVLPVAQATSCCIPAVSFGKGQTRNKRCESKENRRR